MPSVTRPTCPPKPFEFLTHLLLLRQRGNLESEFVRRFQQLSWSGDGQGGGGYGLLLLTTGSWRSMKLAATPGALASASPSSTISATASKPIGLRACWPVPRTIPNGARTSARVSVCSRKFPKTWSEAVSRWSAMNERHRRDGWPDRNAEYLYYQTLVGAWPLSLPRALACMQKAAHEAKEHTCADVPERGLRLGLARIHHRHAGGRRNSLKDLENFVAPLFKPGCINSLAQTLLKLAAPGVPDIYQGTELWDLSLVDPDNRRPVDFALASAVARQSGHAFGGRGVERVAFRVAQALADPPGAEIARAAPGLVWRRCQIRSAGRAWTRAAPTLWRSNAGESLIALAPRLVIGLRNDWRDTTIDMPAGPGATNSPTNRCRRDPRCCVTCWGNFPWRCSRGRRIHDANFRVWAPLPKNRRSPCQQRPPPHEGGRQWLVDGGGSFRPARRRLRIHSRRPRPLSRSAFTLAAARH